MKSIRLGEGEPARLQLHVQGKDIRIVLDGAPVATLHGLEEWKRGWGTTLADGRTLEVRTIRRLLLPELSVLVNGRDAIDSPSHPKAILRGTAQGLLFGSVLFAIMALSGRRTADVYSVGLEALQFAGALLLFRRLHFAVVLIAAALVGQIVADYWLLVAPTRVLWSMVGQLVFAAILVRANMALRDLRQESLAAAAGRK